MVGFSEGFGFRGKRFVFVKGMERLRASICLVKFYRPSLGKEMVIEWS